MLRCLAVDDEPLALELLEDNIRQVPYLHRIASCSNALEAMKVLEREPIDLIFLDIQMPGLTGLQFIETLVNKPMVILVTAYEKFALEGFNLAVVDYLVKPVPLDRFIKACNKAKELYDLRNKPAGSTASMDYFFVNAGYSLIKIVFADILWIEGLKDYVKINLKGSSSPVITRMSMKVLEEELPPNQFLRLHKSFIVNRDQVTAIRKNSVFVGTMEIPVGESYREVLKTHFKNAP